jgi:signal transduction histidine kinase
VLLLASAIASNWHVTERLWERARQDAIAEERGRISRELHDVVAHQMSVVVSQAQGAHAIVDTDPARARNALETISATTREALTEMRRLVAVDRSDAPPPTEVEDPQPGLAYDDYARLAQGAEDAGLQDVSFNLTSDGKTDVSNSVALSAYRLIQESITNAAKHAPGATLAVNADMDAHRLRVEVVNGPAGGPPSDIPGSGVGLVGMQERVAFFGGTFVAGPTPEGGWSVVATFPTLETPPTTS